MSHCFYGAHVVVPEYHLSNRCPRIIRPNSGWRHGKQVVISAYENLADAMMDGHVKLCELCAKGKLFNVRVDDMQRQVWLSERDYKIFKGVGAVLEIRGCIMPKVVAGILTLPRIDVVKSFNLMQKMGLLTRGHKGSVYGTRCFTPVGAAVYEMDKYLEVQRAKAPATVHPYQKL
jgi:hypothetical protein